MTLSSARFLHVHIRSAANGSIAMMISVPKVRPLPRLDHAWTNQGNIKATPPTREAD